MKKLSNMKELAPLWSTDQYIRRGATTIHFTFSDSGAGLLREFFGRTGRREGVVSCGDDYSVGPIDPPDLAIRTQWVDHYSRSVPEHRMWPLPGAEQFWNLATQTPLHRIVWVSRRCVEEYAGFLEWAWRFDRDSYEIIDITEAELHWQDKDSKPRRTKVETLGALSPEHVDVEALLCSAAAISAADQARYRETWRRLRAENAPLRILRRQEIVSTTITHFDDLLVSLAPEQWYDDIRLIGDMIARNLVNVGRDVTFQFLESRIWVLVDQGKLDGRLGPKRWQGSIRRRRARK